MKITSKHEYVNLLPWLYLKYHRGSRESLQHSRKDVMIVVIWMCLTLILFIGVLILRISKQRNATGKRIDRYKGHPVTWGSGFVHCD